MSITAYVGLPGSGKSYDTVANQILPALKQGRRVVTNIPLYEDRIRETVKTGELIELPIEKVSSDPASMWEYATPGCVLVIDEVWRLFPAGQKANHVPEPFRKLLAEHRHMVDEAGNSMQIVLVTQDLKQIGAFARQLVENTVYHTKLSAVGANKSYRIDIYPGCVEGQNPPVQKRLREIFGRYEESITKLYKSHTMAVEGAAGKVNEKNADSRANVWKRPGIWISLVGMVLVFVFAIPAAIKSFRQDDAVENLRTMEGDKPAQTRVVGQSMGTVPMSSSPSYALSCMLLKFSTGDLRCECRSDVGQLVYKGYTCIQHMDSTVGNFGGSTAKSDNVAYLNARDSQSQNKPAS